MKLDVVRICRVMMVAVLHFKTFPYFVLLPSAAGPLDGVCPFTLWAIPIRNIDFYFGINEICLNIDS